MSFLTPFPSFPSSGGSDPARPHSSTGSNHLLGRPVGEWPRSLDDPRFPDCHPYCAGVVHVLTCENTRPRRDDDWARRSEYEEGLR